MFRFATILAYPKLLESRFASFPGGSPLRRDHLCKLQDGSHQLGHRVHGSLHYPDLSRFIIRAFNIPYLTGVGVGCFDLQKFIVGSLHSLYCVQCHCKQMLLEIDTPQRTVEGVQSDPVHPCRPHSPTLFTRVAFVCFWRFVKQEAASRAVTQNLVRSVSKLSFTPTACPQSSAASFRVYEV